MNVSKNQESFRIVPDDWLRPISPAQSFDSEQPLEVDLGAGKGRFLLAHAQRNPGTNFLGIERMLRRIRKMDRKAATRGLRNVRLLRMEAYYAATYLIPDASVRCYYIFFPDPWPKKRHHGNRLFSEPFMTALHRTLIENGAVHIATDHLPYFEEIKGYFQQDARFECVAPFVPDEEEQTDFERYYIERGEIGRCSYARRD
jgi:tRNA (guanine-N7-)-methyltransferase